MCAATNFGRQGKVCTVQPSLRRLVPSVQSSPMKWPAVQLRLLCEICGTEEQHTILPCARTGFLSRSPPSFSWHLIVRSLCNASNMNTRGHLARAFGDYFSGFLSFTCTHICLDKCPFLTRRLGNWHSGTKRRQPAPSPRVCMRAT